jgi:hypothetical protein
MPPRGRFFRADRAQRPYNGGTMRIAPRQFCVPLVILAALVAVWGGLGWWVARVSPYASGTDESIRYVAFAAAADRWATLEDYRRYGIEHFYYPPLYFLAFSPFWGREEAFLDGYPTGMANDPDRAMRRGGTLTVSKEYLRKVPPVLDRLYRSAKLASLAFGLGAILAVAATIGLLVGGPGRGWLVLAGTAPVVLLPQFLYYQTLVNNDALLNLLAALAILAFVVAMRRAGEGRATASRGWGLASSALIGLGILTKQSALVLLPLPVALAALPLGDRGVPAGRRWGRAGITLGIHLLVIFAAGGWWLLRSWLEGDPFGTGAQLASHAWAFRPREIDAGLLWYVLSRSARTYLALFAGSLYGIPDRIYLAYLALPAAFLGALGIRWMADRRAPKGEAPAPAPGDPLVRLTWGALAAVVLLNIALLVAYNTRVIAPHGRLLFPSLAASHAWLALGLRRIAPGKAQAAAIALLVTASLGLLFGWTFRHRLVPAVIQEPARLVALGILPPTMNRPTYVGFHPWERDFSQGVTLPAGRLEGLRLLLLRKEMLPQAGTVIRASLRIESGPAGAWNEVPFEPFAVGDNDAVERWSELRLARPLELDRETSGWLLLRCDKPWFMPPGTASYYATVPPATSPRLGPLMAGVERIGAVLAMSAVYR